MDETTEKQITLLDVMEFTLTASPEDLDRITAFVQDRRKVFKNKRALAVRVGAQVKLLGLSPKALNDLRGEVTVIKGERCDVMLDKDSTRRLAFGRTKFAAPASRVDNYVLHGVPLGCAEAQ
jgi:hypothetical protein